MTKRLWKKAHLDFSMFFFILAIVMFTQCQPQHAFPALPKPIKKVCPVPAFDQYDKLVGAGWNLIEGRYWRLFDLDENKQEDYYVIYELRGINSDNTFRMSPFPVRVYLDTNGDGLYDKGYVDAMGNGRCEDFLPIEELLPQGGPRAGK